MAIVICNSNLVDNSLRENCTQSNINLCCNYCFKEDCNDQCYYSIHAIDCKDIRFEKSIDNCTKKYGNALKQLAKEL